MCARVCLCESGGVTCLISMPITHGISAQRVAVRGYGIIFEYQRELLGNTPSVPDPIPRARQT